MTDRPISFSAEMARALHSGTKTQTRRLAKRSYFRTFNSDERWVMPTADALTRALDGAHGFVREGRVLSWIGSREGLSCMRTVPEIGDELWVKEPILRAGRRIKYESDGAVIDQLWRWKPVRLPGMYMPKSLSRVRVRLTGFDVEPLQRISEADAIAEGLSARWIVTNVMSDKPFSYRDGYRYLWELLNDRPGQRWDDNPWVVRLTFEIV